MDKKQIYSVKLVEVELFQVVFWVQIALVLELEVHIIYHLGWLLLFFVHLMASYWFSRHIAWT